MKRQGNTTQIKEQTRNTEIQIPDPSHLECPPNLLPVYLFELLTPKETLYVHIL